MLDRTTRVLHRDHAHAARCKRPNGCVYEYVVNTTVCTCAREPLATYTEKCVQLTTMTCANRNASRRHRYENKGDAAEWRKNTVWMRRLASESVHLNDVIISLEPIHGILTLNFAICIGADDDAVTMYMLQLDDCGVATTTTTTFVCIVVNDGQQRCDVFSIDASLVATNHHSRTRALARNVWGGVSRRSMLPILWSTSNLCDSPSQSSC